MAQDEMAAFGQKLKEYRKQKGLTQDELASIIGVQKAAISKYENGRIKNIPNHIVFNLAIALGKKVSEYPFDKILFTNESSWTSPNLANEALKREQIANSVISLLFYDHFNPKTFLSLHCVETLDFFILDKKSFSDNELQQIKTYIEFIISQHQSKGWYENTNNP